MARAHLQNDPRIPHTHLPPCAYAPTPAPIRSSSPVAPFDFWLGTASTASAAPSGFWLSLLLRAQRPHLVFGTNLLIELKAAGTSRELENKDLLQLAMAGQNTNIQPIALTSTPYPVSMQHASPSYPTKTHAPTLWRNRAPHTRSRPGAHPQNSPHRRSSPCVIMPMILRRRSTL